MFEKHKDAAEYEGVIRKIKKEHFNRVKDLEDSNHALSDKLANIVGEHERAMKKMELDYEQRILTLKHQLELEQEKLELRVKEIDLEKTQKLADAEREIAQLRDEFHTEKFDKMEALADKEKETLRTILMFAMNKLPGQTDLNLELDGNIVPQLAKKLGVGTDDQK